MNLQVNQHVKLNRRAFVIGTATAGAGLALNQGAAYLIGALVGGALALAGVALGARIARRH